MIETKIKNIKKELEKFNRYKFYEEPHIYTYVYIKIYKDHFKFFTDSFGLNINNENASSL